MASILPSTYDEYKALYDKAHDEVTKVKIDLRQHIPERQLETMCEFEKTVSINRIQNYLIMEKLGNSISLTMCLLVL